MRYLVLVLLVGMLAGCSGGPKVKQDCPLVTGTEEFSCKGDTRSYGCVFVPDKDRWLCDK